MKHVLFIFFTTLLFTGCGKDEDKEVELDFKPTTPTEIVGLWGRQDGAKYYYYKFNDETNGSYQLIDKAGPMDTYYKFTYTIGTTGDPYIMEYTLKDGTKKNYRNRHVQMGKLNVRVKRVLQIRKIDYGL